MEERNFNFQALPFRYSQSKMAKLFANSGDPDQMMYSATSDLGLHCLPVTLFWGVSRLKWVDMSVVGKMVLRQL